MTVRKTGLADTTTDRGGPRPPSGKTMNHKAHVFAWISGALATVALATSLWIANSLEGRVRLTEERSQINAVSVAETKVQYAEISRRLERIEAKLDDLASD